jgi:hypothetical protein
LELWTVLPRSNVLVGGHIGQVLVRSVRQEPEVIACGLECSLFGLVGC